MHIQPKFIILAAMAALLTGCEEYVAKQDIPVSSNPMGADVRVNGEARGTTPTTVTLERNRDHIITLTKSGFRQEDILITRQYQNEKVLLNAVNSGLRSGEFFKSGSMGLSSGVSSISEQEKNGEAYILQPSAVSVALTSLNGSTTPSSRVSQTGQAPSLGNSNRSDSWGSDPETQKAIAQGALGAAGTQIKPVGKDWSSSSETTSYKADGTQVTKKKGVSGGVKVNPADAASGVIDLLF